MLQGYGSQRLNFLHTEGFPGLIYNSQDHARGPLNVSNSNSNGLRAAAHHSEHQRVSASVLELPRYGEICLYIPT